MLFGLLYEAIMDKLGFCPIPVVCGVNRLGNHCLEPYRQWAQFLLHCEGAVYSTSVLKIISAPKY